MKVCIEIKPKVLKLAMSILMSQTDKEEEEKKLEEIGKKMENCEEPYLVDFDKIEDDNVKQLPLALTLFVIAQELGIDV